MGLGPGLGAALVLPPGVGGTVTGGGGLAAVPLRLRARASALGFSGVSVEGRGGPGPPGPSQLWEADASCEAVAVGGLHKERVCVPGKVLFQHAGGRSLLACPKAHTWPQLLHRAGMRAQWPWSRLQPSPQTRTLALAASAFC